MLSAAYGCSLRLCGVVEIGGWNNVKASLKEQSSDGKFEMGGKNKPQFITWVEGSGVIGNQFYSNLLNVISPETTTLSKMIPHDANRGVPTQKSKLTSRRQYPAHSLSSACLSSSASAGLVVVVGPLVPILSS